METLSARSYNLSKEFIEGVTDCVEIKMGLSPGSITPVISEDMTSVDWMFENKILQVPTQFKLDCFRENNRSGDRTFDYEIDMKTRGEDISVTDVVTGKISIIQAFEHACEDVINVILSDLAECPIRYKKIIPNINEDEIDKYVKKFKDIDHLWYRELDGAWYLAHNDEFLVKYS